jgi:hypothetical protein
MAAIKAIILSALNAVLSHFQSRRHPGSTIRLSKKLESSRFTCAQLAHVLYDYSSLDLSGSIYGNLPETNIPKTSIIMQVGCKDVHVRFEVEVRALAVMMLRHGI